MRAFACDASACDANASACDANALASHANARITDTEDAQITYANARMTHEKCVRMQCDANARIRICSHMLALYALASYANAHMCSHNGRYALLMLQMKYGVLQVSIWCVVIHVAFVLGRNNNSFVSSTAYQLIWPFGLSTHNFVATIYISKSC